MKKFHDLKEILEIHHSNISEDTLLLLSEVIEMYEFKKSDTIISNKGYCSKCFFLSEGFVRSYINDEGSEHTLWFGEKGDLVTSYETLFTGKKGKEIIIALSDCILYAIDMNYFKNLVQTNIEIALIYSKFIEIGYQFWENRFIILSQLNVEKRYNEWMSRTKHLAPYVPLKVLAQYLNIDQATLSRVRGKQKL